MTEVKEDYKKKQSRLRCVGDRVIVKLKETAVKELALGVDVKDKHAIALEHPYQGVVIKVGDGKMFDREGYNPIDLNPGDIVYFDRVNYPPLMYDFGDGMQNYLVIRESNIHLVERK